MKLRSVLAPFFLVLLFVIAVPQQLLSKVSLPRLISDGMVLQRNSQANIWGWADPGEEVSVRFRGQTYTTTANQQGDWLVKIATKQAGGPYNLEIEGNKEFTIEDVYVGEVWVSSGQSNMELPMRRVKPLYEHKISEAGKHQIRYFNVPNRYNFQQPVETLEGGTWVKSTPETVLDFSATAYFFALDLHQKYGVPVGIINASLGGSPAESWISEDALQEHYPEYYQEAQKFKDSTLINRIQRQDRQRAQKWYAMLNKRDKAYDAPLPWYKPGVRTADWPTMQVPGYWADNTELGAVNGVVWFRKTFTVPENRAGHAARLNLGRIVDADSVFINGRYIGNTTYQYPPRWYRVPEGVLRAGENTIAIRVINSGGKGGFVLDKPYRLTIGQTMIDLKGSWKYKLGAKMRPLEPQTFIRWKPVGLYNAMIAPLLNYQIKGVIWYQGESNTGKPKEYRDLFGLVIKTWREQWNQGDFPFLFVQLANFMKPREQPVESNWAQLRESQRETLELPNTAMAVTIDIGEWNDIHPLNKKDVGHRLALGAQKVAYGEEVVYSGPMIQSTEREDHKVVLHFDHVDGGLVSRSGALGGFAIAGRDQNFVWANARIEGDRVIVWSDQVANPTVVRYGWADNPVRANLFNEAGLPVSPFEVRVEAGE